jgi:hypothetical protein
MGKLPSERLVVVLLIGLKREITNAKNKMMVPLNVLIYNVFIRLQNHKIRKIKKRLTFDR